MAKFVISTNMVWIIRSVTDTRVTYYECRRIWNSSPVSATKFMSKDAAEHVLWDLENGANRLIDGEELSVVTFEDAIRPFLNNAKGQ